MRHTPFPPHVVIVGGGLAGLAAASALADRGLRLTLLESRPRLGGRASSFPDPATGELVDNCQHVSMRCCTNLAAFCDRVGTSDLFRRVPSIRFLSPEGRISELRAGWLPAPLHLSGSFLRANYLTWLDRLRVAYGMAWLRATRPGRLDQPFRDWLLSHGQNERTIERFWGTVLVSALNERLEQMDVGHARKVFVDGFLRSRHGFELEIPVVPLGDLYGARLQSWLGDHGITVRLATGVQEVELDEEEVVSGVRLRSGERLAADFVVLAVPFDRLLDLLPVPARERVPELSRKVRSLTASPTTGVHLWLDRAVCPFDHVVTVGRLVQWVFNHTRIQGRQGDEVGEYLQVVISASYELTALDKHAIRDAVLRDLASIWPESSQAKLLRWWVVTEHGATFAVRPGVDAYRPSQRTPIEGLVLAGDWTATGWPATMEGAVRSGYLAAEAILEELGRPEPLVQDDLAQSWLSRLLLGPMPQTHPTP